MTDQQALAELQAGIERARKLHPQFARNRKEGLKAIRSEIYELGQAIACKEGIDREKAEALDVAITAMRYYLGEYLPQITCKRCGKIFTPHARNQKYCSEICAALAWRQQIRERSAMRRKEKAAPQARTGAISAVDSYSYGKHDFGAENGCQAAL